MSQSLHSLNVPEKSVPSSLKDTLELYAPPNTDIWRKPPSTFSFNAPIVYQTIPLASFRSARVSITGDWVTKFDQGGLFFGIPDEKVDGKEGQWLKSGIEFFEGEPMGSCVATDRWSDWSLISLASGGKSAKGMTVEFERETLESGELASTLWVYHVLDDGSRIPMREVSWVFEHADIEGKMCWIGVAAARPSKADKPLRVVFENFKLVTA